MKKLNLKKGFSLVELLVVITIIAILSVVAYTAVGGQTAKAKNSRRMQDLGAIQTALEIYFAENGSYPDMLDGADPTKKPPETDLTPKQMPKMALDPVTKAMYTYAVHPTSKKTYQLGATLEIEESPYFKAYVIGNGIDLLSGVEVVDMTTVCKPVKDKTCFPYNPVAPTK